VGEPIPWLAIVSTPAMWFICWQHVFRAAGYIFYATWFPRFLQEVHGVSMLNSGLLASLPLLVVIAGSPLGGMTSDWVLSMTGSRRIGRQFFAAACMLLCAGLILVAWRVRDPLLAAAVISAGSFCAAFGGPCAYAITMDMGGKHVATVFSVMNAFGSLGAATFPIVIPYIVKFSGWNAVMLVFAGIYVAAALCWVAFDPNVTIGGSATRADP
jgi:nitrate/nitrite transporter NarK